MKIALLAIVLALLPLPAAAQSDPPPLVVAAVLPFSRAVQVGTAATAFATILNAGPGTATGCSIAPTNAPTGTTFSYQQTNAANVPIGQPNTPATIPSGNGQSFVISLTPTAAFPATDIQFAFACANTSVAVLPGVNTFLLTSTISRGPDILGLLATPTKDGIVNILPDVTGTGFFIPDVTGTGFFSVATVNVGAGAPITVTADTGNASLPVDVALCETNPSTGGCINPPGSSATRQIQNGETPTFAVFVRGTGSVPFLPGVNRLFVRFKTAGGATVGATSAAVRTQ